MLRSCRTFFATLFVVLLLVPIAIVDSVRIASISTSYPFHSATYWCFTEINRALIYITWTLFAHMVLPIFASDLIYKNKRPKAPLLLLIVSMIALPMQTLWYFVIHPSIYLEYPNTFNYAWLAWSAVAYFLLKAAYRNEASHEEAVSFPVGKEAQTIKEEVPTCQEANLLTPAVESAVDISAVSFPCKSTDTAFCKHCGSNIDSDSRYCRYCGGRLTTEEGDPYETRQRRRQRL